MASGNREFYGQGQLHDDRVLAATDYLIDVSARLRAALPEKAFGDPVLDVLLPLFRADLRGEEVTVGGLVAASGVPHATLIRWIAHLERSGAVRCLSDADDGRRSFVVATATTSDAIRRCLLDAEEVRTGAPGQDQPRR